MLADDNWNLYRAYIGGSKCDMRKDSVADTADLDDELWGISLISENSRWGSIMCKMDGTYVGQ